ncbi:MAG TPA: histidine phosphatase family protein [Acidimicrobiales bacterium]|nr:histidine phosphatase family protein [Acidimicrobiales bacterium]
MSDQLWPARLSIIRHGESAGNVASDAAEAAGHPMIDIAHRDMDVPLSALGQLQAGAVGRWLADRGGDELPTVVVCSPYVRACSTAELLLGSAGLRPHHDVEFVVDERVREREFGILDRLTKVGIAERHPEQAEFRAHLGKFYHRPPGGESWADVVLRVRSLIDTIGREFHGERVLVVTHQVVVLMFRYVLEHMDESQIMAIDRSEAVANCSVTTFEHDPRLGRKGGMRLVRFNEVAPLEREATPVTTEPDVPAGPK